MRIDSHHHFWQYNTAEFGWIDDAMSNIRRDFLPGDLQAEIQAAGIEGVVSVQARQCIEETRFLLDLAADNSFIRGVVGWVPLVDAKVEGILDEFARNPRLKSVRHVLQGEPDDRYMLREDFNSGISLLQKYNLAYDILVLERHIPFAVEFVDRHPEQVFVLDHIAKPRIGDREIEPWRRNITELARRPNVYCKLSGMVTEADYRTWTVEQLAPYFETALEAFGPARLMFGSDWPVCLVACGYRRWLDIVKAWIQPLGPEDQASILGGNAVRAYRL